MKLHSRSLLKTVVVLGCAATQAADAERPPATGVIFENVRIFSGTSEGLSVPSNVLVVGNVIKTISSAPIAAPPETAVTRIAVESGVTLTTIIEESLRERFARKHARTKMRQPARLHVTGRGGVRAGVDLDDSASLIDLMESRR